MSYTLSNKVDFLSQDLYSRETIAISNNGLWCATSEGGVIVIRKLRNGTWSIEQTLTLPESRIGENISIAFNKQNNILAVGSGINSSLGGRVFVYHLVSDNWTLGATLEDPKTPSNKFYGASVFLTNTMLTVGAGTFVYVYTLKSSGEWALLYKIESTAHCSLWKYTTVTEIERETLTLSSVAGLTKNQSLKFRGSLLGTSSNLKTYYVKDIVNSTITVSEELGGPAVNLGSGIGEMQVEFSGIPGIENFEPRGFGFSVCMNAAENLLFVGAPLTNFHNLRTNVGAVCVYKKEAEKWNLQKVLYDATVNEYNEQKYEPSYNKSNFTNGSMFGCSLSLSSTMLAVGAKGERYIREFMNSEGSQSSELLENVGSTYLYQLSTLSLVKTITADQIADDLTTPGINFGSSVQLSTDGSAVFISAPKYESGAIFIARNTASWSITDKITVENTEGFGSSFSVDDYKNVIATDDRSISSINAGSANSIYYHTQE